MRILTLDIETTPNVADLWQLHGDHHVGLNQLHEVTRVLCFAAKWTDSKKVMFHSEWGDGHAGMVEAARDLMDSADAIVGFNSKRFDCGHLRREILLEGLTPPSPHKDIDLLSTCRSQFKFTSNKLDHVADVLGIGTKLKHEGHGLWTACLAGDPKALKRMENYNKMDVKLTEKLYFRLLPWIRNHPNVALYDGLLEACPKCAGTDLMRRGVTRTSVGVYQRYQCKGCGGYCQDRRSTGDTTKLKAA